jgi:hypothetical protein
VRGVIVLSLLLLSACTDYPRDIDGTLDRVRESRELRIGETPILAKDRRLARNFVTRLARATGALPRISTAPEERQLARLEQGELDLVIGEFAEDSPWAEHAALIEPLTVRRVGERKLGLAPVARNGENAWIAVVEREVRNARAER